MDVKEQKAVQVHDSPSHDSVSGPTALRHPLEERTVRVVLVLDAIMVVTVLGLLIWGTEWLEGLPVVGRFTGEAKVLLAAVFAAPVMATYARRRRRIQAQEESIRVSETQLPEVHQKLVAYCERVGIPVPELYLSEAIDRTTTFTWQDHTCVILSTHEISAHPESFDDILEFTLAREVGSICLGHASFKNELLASFVAPIPFLRAPLSHMRTYSRDRYGAFLAPRAIRALLSEATGERLRNRVDLDAYFAQLDQSRGLGLWASMISLVKVRLPLTYRVRELRRAGLLKKP